MKNLNNVQIQLTEAGLYNLLHTKLSGHPSQNDMGMLAKILLSKADNALPRFFEVHNLSIIRNSSQFSQFLNFLRDTINNDHTIDNNVFAAIEHKIRNDVYTDEIKQLILKDAAATRLEQNNGGAMRNIRYQSPGMRSIAPYNLLNMPAIPIIYPYHPTGESEVGINDRVDNGVPSFNLAYKLPVVNLDSLPPGSAQILTAKGVGLDNVSCFVSVQNNPWQNDRLLLRPHPWLAPDAPARGHYNAQHSVSVAIAKVGTQFSSIAAVNLSTHNENASPNNVVFFQRELELENLPDHNTTSNFYSIVINENNRSAAITYHSLLNDNDQRRFQDAIGLLNGMGVDVSLAGIITCLSADNSGIDTTELHKFVTGDRAAIDLAQTPVTTLQVAESRIQAEAARVAAVKEKAAKEKEKKEKKEKKENKKAAKAKAKKEKKEKAAPAKEEKAAPEKDEKAAPEKEEKAAPEKDEKAAPEKDEKAAPEKDEKAKKEQKENKKAAKAKEKKEKDAPAKKEKAAKEKEEKENKKAAKAKEKKEKKENKKAAKAKEKKENEKAVKAKEKKEKDAPAKKEKAAKEEKAAPAKEFDASAARVAAARVAATQAKTAKANAAVQFSAVKTATVNKPVNKPVNAAQPRTLW